MIEVIHGEAQEIAADLLALEPDVQIVDPPYSDHVHDNATSIGSDGRGARSRDLEFAPLSPYLRTTIALVAASVRRWSIVFSDFEGSAAWLADADEAGAEWVRPMICTPDVADTGGTMPWERWSQPQLSGDRPCTAFEMVLALHAQRIGERGGRKPIKKHWNGPGSLTHLTRRCMRGQDKHPTEKPIDLLLDLVSWFSDPDELVLDLCAGSGSTPLACRLLGRRCIAVERDKLWAATARGRVSGPLSDRDRARAQEWCLTTTAEAERVPSPRADDGSDVRTWERAQRRLADVGRVLGAL